MQDGAALFGFCIVGGSGDTLSIFNIQRRCWRGNESDTVSAIMSVTVQTHDEVGLTHHSSHMLTAGNMLVLLSCSAYLIFQQRLAALSCEIFRNIPVFDGLVLHN